jgi:molecular chaperone GrpE
MAEDTAHPDNAPDGETSTADVTPDDSRDAELIALREEAGQLKDRLLRLAADMDNLRKRTDREKAEATLYAATNFARDLLSVADDLGRALSAVPEETRSKLDEATRNLLAGVEVTERALINAFGRHGIRKIQTIGQKFDPNMHQAMFEIPSSEFDPGTVVEEVQAGYAIGERCLRPALVGVSRKPDQN